MRDGCSKRSPHPPSSGLDEFRKLCQLLTLVTALNDPDHHSTLNTDHPHVVLRPLDSPEDSLSHAVTSILARDNETLACMFDEPVFLLRKMIQWVLMQRVNLVGSIEWTLRLTLTRAVLCSRLIP